MPKKATDSAKAKAAPKLPKNQPAPGTLEAEIQRIIYSTEDGLLTPKIIKDFAIDFFLKKNMNLFIYGNDIEQSQVAKIINIF